jgi:hypothetical protein
MVKVIEIGYEEMTNNRFKIEKKSSVNQVLVIVMSEKIKGD